MRARYRVGTAVDLVILIPLCFFALANWSITLHEVARFYINLPMWDYWNIVEHYASYRRFDLRVLWGDHNGHRIILPEITFALDMLFFRGRQIVPTVLSVCCYLGVLSVMVWALLDDKCLRVATKICAIAVAATVMGWKGSAAVLGIPFLLQWTMVALFAASSLGCLALFKRRSDRLWLLLTITSSIAATYSSSNGMVLWPILLSAGPLLRFSRSELLTMATAGALSVGLYFIHYQPEKAAGNVADIHGFLTHPIYLWGFVFSYLSMPFGALGSPWFGITLGSVSLAVLFAAIALAFRCRLLSTPASIVLFGYCAFVILSALMTASGRMNPSDPYYQSPRATRYLLMATTYWAALVLVTIWILAQRFGPLPSTAFAVIFALMMLRIFPELAIWYHGQKNAFADQQWAALALENGIMDQLTNSILFPDPGYVMRFNPVLRANHLAVFSTTEPYWLGRMLTDIYPNAAGNAHSGSVAYVFPLQEGFGVAGWTNERLSVVHPLRFLLVNQAQRVVGLGEQLPAGLPDRFSSSGLRSKSAWVGFINPSFGSSSFSTYLIDPHAKGIMPIGQATVIPPVRLVSRSGTGTELAGLQWQSSSGWVRNRVPPKIEVGDAPLGGFFSSWAGSDQSTGTLFSSVFAAPKDGCLIFPVIHGPSTDGLSEEVVDADTRQTILWVPLGLGTTWQYLRLETTASRRLKVVARDNGRGWGQWLAVGTPSQCR